MLKITQEKRLDPRVRVQVRVELCDPGRTRNRVLLTTNLSACGARCTGRALLEVGAAVEARIVLPFSEAGRDQETAVSVTARVVHASAHLDPTGSELLSEYGLSWEGLDEAGQDEVRDFLLEVMAADSAWHGPAGEDA
jgi:hypothetical protein